MTWDFLALLPIPDEGVLQIFIALAGFEPVAFGFSGQHTNRYTAKATMS
jgi:hypothetical protein